MNIYIKHTLTILLALMMAAAGCIPFPALADEGDDQYEEWQTESDGYTEESVSVEFSLEGISSAEIRIAGSDEWDIVSDGDKRDAVRSDYIEVKGVEGYWISAAWGETKSEAKSSAAATLSDEAGGNTSAGVDNEGFIHIRASSDKKTAAGSAASEDEDADGNISWDSVSNAQADAGTAKSTSVYRKGQVFYGRAKAISRVGRQHGSTITFKHETGWLKNETKVKTITAVCISGGNRGLAYVGAIFNYTATIKQVSSKGIKVEVIYYPRKNKPNSGPYGTSLPKAQIMAKTLWVKQYNHTGHVTLVKEPAKTETQFLSEAPNNYTLKGAVYRLYTDSECKKPAANTDGKEIVLTTRADGTTETAEVDLKSDKAVFYAKEITASKGFKLDTKVRSVEVSTENTEDSPAVIRSVEEPVYSMIGIEIEKRSERFSVERLTGTQYKLSYYDLEPGTDPAGKKPKRSWIAETTAEGDILTQSGARAAVDFANAKLLDGSDEPYLEGGRILPLGVFSIEEIRAPKGLARDENLYGGKVEQKSNGADATASMYGGSSTMSAVNSPKVSLINLDEPQTPEIRIRKVDAETMEAEAQGTDREFSRGSLAGAEYRVYFDDDQLPEPEFIGTIITDENGEGSLTKRAEGNPYLLGTVLEPGSYIIEEVKASPGYVLDRFFHEEEKGVYKDGKHYLRARVKEPDTKVFTYTVTSGEPPHHTYIRKTDAVSGAEIPGAKLRVINSDGNTVDEWISGDEPHDIAALPDGKYTLREIRAPYGYDIADDIEFEVREDEVECEVEMKNKPVVITTTASDAGTGTHHGTKSKEAEIKDLVRISGLYEGRRYKITGQLMDRKTEEVITDEEGDPVEAEHEFTAEGDEAELELVFRADTSEFTEESSVVAFEKLFRVSPVTRSGPSADGDEEELPKELAKHEDPDNDDQTIRYGGIAATKAADKYNGSQNVLAGPETVVHDTVEFRNLSPKEKYTLEGELYDKTAGHLTGIKARAEFTPGMPDGKTAVEFRFDASGFENHVMVAFETLTVNGLIVSRHDDPEDADQTVYLPKIRTVVSEAKNKKAVDKVTYENLIPGQNYVMKGWFVDKKTGKKIKRSDGKTSFTPDKPEGSVDVKLKLAGAKGDVVAYEYCYIVTKDSSGKRKETIVATHTDIEDEKQTLKYSPRSSPKTGDDNTLFVYILILAMSAALLAVMRRLRA